MSYDCRVVIERVANGYTVCVKDPKIVKQNSEKNANYKDPERLYYFSSGDKALEFIENNLDKALPEYNPDPSFDTAFDKAAKEVEKEEKD
jgi:hypothetical protein